jgi:DeoR family transcriptional regulator of aga operon
VTEPPEIIPKALPVQGMRARLPANRQRLIAALLRERGSLSVADVEEACGVSPMTARRDLVALEKAGLALRTYGGAILRDAGADEGTFDQRLATDVGIKEQLARAALAYINDHDTLFVDSSTASLYATRSLLAAERKLTIATNSLPVLELLRRARGVETIALGGSYDPIAARFVGPETVRSTQTLHADKLLMSTSGLTSDGWLTDVDKLEAEVKRTMIEHSHEAILLITSSEFRTRGINVYASLRDMTHVLHTTDLSDHEASQLTELAHTVHRV